MLTRAAAAAATKAAADAAAEAAEAEPEVAEAELEVAAAAAAEADPEAAAEAEADPEAAAEVDPEAAAAAEAAAAQQMVREMARAQLTRTATLILSGTNCLSYLIDSTAYSRAMLASAIDRLHEVAYALDIPVNGAGRILALHLNGEFVGLLPAGSINAARRIAGHLSGLLPRAAYPQISQCRLNVTILANLFEVEAYAHLITCTEMLGLADESPQSQRWSDRMEVGGPLTSMGARRRLVEADVLAADVHWVLLRLVTYWHPDGDRGAWRRDPSVDLSWAEESLHAATNLMDEALVRMRRIRDTVPSSSRAWSF